MMMFGSFAICVVLWMISYCSGKYVGLAKMNGTLPTESQWYFYVDNSTGRMVSAATDRFGQFQDCYLSGDSSLISLIAQSVPQSNVTEVDTKTMDEIAEECTFAKRNGIFTSENGEVVWEQFGIFSGFFIYPGTKWCGAGNVSSGYDDLGPEAEADACCREHDHCEDNIEAFDSKYGLQNTSPFTKSHCDCDEDFFECLNNADTRTSHRVGRIFFNVLQMECFREDFPVTGCKKYKGWFRRRCLEYEYDLERDVEWQFFDAQHYEGTSNDEDEENEVEDEYRGDVFEYMLRLADINEGKFHHVVLKQTLS